MLAGPQGLPSASRVQFKICISAGKRLQLGHTKVVNALNLPCNFLAFPAQNNSDIIYK